MDYLKHPNPKAHNQLLSHNSKRLSNLLLSVSLLCVLFCLLPLCLHSLKPFLTQFFSYNIDKTYMFLLCNSLLAFIAMTSGLSNASSTSTHQSTECVVESEKSSTLESNPSEIAAGEKIMETESPEEEEEEEEENGYEILEPDNVLSDTQEDEEEGNALMIIDECEHASIDEDEHEHGADNTEELNKKCEDFIKKMKAVFSSERRADYSSCFDDQKSLVAV